jgi:ATP-dependent helicase HrpA
MDPPDPRAVRNALDLLQEIGALQLVQSPGAAQQQLQIAAGGAAASTSADKGLVYVDQDQQQQQHHQRWSLTSLGHVLAELPLNPRLGKMLVLGAVYG